MGTNYAQQINNQVRTRTSLQQNNNQLRSYIGELTGKKRQLETRLRQVTDIRNTVDKGLDGEANDVATKQRNLASDVEHAVKMQGFTEDTINRITSAIEPDLSNDSDGSSMISQLNNEIRRIQSELEDTNRSIDDANRRIDSNNRSIQVVNNNIRNLQRAQAQEQARG